MVRSYIIIAWRSMMRHKSFTFINILGLALGVTCSLLIMLWIQDERDIDHFHQHGNELYQVYERQYYDGKVEAAYSTQGLLAEELKRVVPEINHAAGLEYAAMPGTGNTFQVADKVIKLQGFYAGEDFLNMFSYPLLEGKKENALQSPNAIAISEKMADVFFGSPQAAIGKTLRFDSHEDLMVTAVFKDIPPKSSIQFDFLRSWTDFKRQNKWVNNWSNTSPSTYVQLQKDADVVKVEKKIKDFIYRYKSKDAGSVMELHLQSFPSRYLHSNFSNGEIYGGRIEYIRLFTVVAIFIMLIACINFMNLSTAQSAKRAKEIGLRKVIGASRSGLIGQFLGEALLLTFFAVVVALILSALIMPVFNSLTGKSLSLPLSRPDFLLLLLVMVLITGLIAGSYPAVFLSSIQSAKALKGKLTFNASTLSFRKALVVFQFVLSIVLIIGMIVIYRQMQYIETKNLGYDRENLVYIPIEGDLVNKYQLFKSEVAKLSSVVSISKMRNSPTVIEHHTNSISWSGKDDNLFVSFADAVVGYDFAKTLSLQMVEGRDFSPAYGTDSMSYLLNETAVQKMGLKNPVGQRVSWGNRPGTIVGVIKDFHFNSMHQPIDPLIVRLDENWGWGTILVRIKAGHTKEAISSIEGICKSLNPEFPFTYQFSDLEYTKLYRSEQVVSKLSDYFAFLAIFISCLGLLGLAIYTASQRRKEIGVRKVLGASVSSIVAMLSLHFLKLVGIAMLIAFPLSWIAMNKWLQNFSYKIDIEWWMFLVAGIATISIALATVSYQSLKAALGNPVKTLRDVD